VLLLTLGRLFMPSLSGRAHSTRTHRSGRQPANQSLPVLRAIPRSTLRVVFRAWPICPTSDSIVSPVMKQLFGAKPVRSCLLSMRWIVANHKKEAAVSVLAAETKCRPTSAMSVDVRARRSTQPARSCRPGSPERGAINTVKPAATAGLAMVSCRPRPARCDRDTEAVDLPSHYDRGPDLGPLPKRPLPSPMLMYAAIDVSIICAASKR
jgi:hypothetical protein